MQQIEISQDELIELKEKAKRQITIAEALSRLHNNPDFKLVFLENYLKEEPVRLVHMLGSIDIIYGNHKEACAQDNHEQMIGIARLYSYMRNVFKIADNAQKTLDQINEAEHEAYSYPTEIEEV